MAGLEKISSKEDVGHEIQPMCLDVPPGQTLDTKRTPVLNKYLWDNTNESLIRALKPSILRCCHESLPEFKIPFLFVSFACMIIHICPPVPPLLPIWSMQWQGVNWLGPAVCMCTGVCLCACLPRHTNVCLCICQRGDSVSAVSAALAHVALLLSERLRPPLLTCALWLLSRRPALLDSVCS